MPRRPEYRLLGSRTVGGSKIALIKTPKGERYLSGGKTSRRAFGPMYRGFGWLKDQFGNIYYPRADSPRYGGRR